MALKFMAAKPDGELTSAREICLFFNTPFDTTAKVMQVMNLNNILTSVKGVKGGYTLTKSLKEVTFMELTEMIEGKTSNPVCLTGGKPCSVSSCNIIDPISMLNQRVGEYLEKLTLHELLFEADKVNASETVNEQSVGQ